MSVCEVGEEIYQEGGHSSRVDNGRERSSVDSECCVSIPKISIIK